MSRASSARRIAAAAVYGGGGLAGLGIAGFGVLMAEAKVARRAIGRPFGLVGPDATGLYGEGPASRSSSPCSVTPARSGSASATPGTRRAPCSRPGWRRWRARRPPRSSAVGGAQSRDLAGQLERLLHSSPLPHAALIMIGANDMTHRVRPAERVHALGLAVRRAARARHRRRRRHLPRPRHDRADPPAAALAGPRVEPRPGRRPDRGRRRGRGPHGLARRPARAGVRGPPDRDVQRRPVPPVRPRLRQGRRGPAAQRVRRARPVAGRRPRAAARLPARRGARAASRAPRCGPCATPAPRSSASELGGQRPRPARSLGRAAAPPAPGAGDATPEPTAGTAEPAQPDEAQPTATSRDSPVSGDVGVEGSSTRRPRRHPAGGPPCPRPSSSRPPARRSAGPSRARSRTSGRTTWRWPRSCGPRWPRCPSLDPAELDDLYLGCAEPWGEHGIEHGPGRRGAGRAGPPARRHGQPVLRVQRADHPDGLPRDQGRRGRRVRLGRRRVRVAGTRASPAPGRATRTGSNPLFARRRGAQRGHAASNETWHDPRQDGQLPDVYLAMGQTAENVATLRGISRARQDEWGVREPEPGREGHRRRASSPARSRRSRRRTARW